MAVEVYRVMFVNQVAVNVTYFAWILKCLKPDPSISLIDDSAAATQPLCQSGWCSHSATLPEWLEQPLSHSARVAGAATQTLSHSPYWLEQPLRHSATQPFCHSRCQSGTQPLSQPLCQSGWSSHSATQPLSHSATVAARVAGAATQPLSHSARVAGAATQPLSQSGWSSHSATQPLCQSGWSSHSATQPFCHSRCQSGWSSHSATLPQSLEQPLSHSVTQSGWVAEWLMWKFPPLRVQSKDRFYSVWGICDLQRLQVALARLHLQRHCPQWSQPGPYQPVQSQRETWPKLRSTIVKYCQWIFCTHVDE